MIILHGNNNEVLDVRLSNILKHLENSDKIFWKLLWVDGVSYHIRELPFSQGKHMLDFEKYINNSPSGIRISTKELLQLSDVMHDLIEITIIGDENEQSLIKLENDDEIKSHCTYFIELIDSSYWEIMSKDESFLKSIKRDFNYKEID
ncbi:hypothetical protein LJC29_04590 [Bacteroides sp. OttesenSCG-928-N06]|nr:hypothetical protein [Bacteroides sp. OttesenSCG-928-N06]